MEHSEIHEPVVLGSLPSAESQGSLVHDRPPRPTHDCTGQAMTLTVVGDAEPVNVSDWIHHWRCPIRWSRPRRPVPRQKTGHWRMRPFMYNRVVHEGDWH